METGRKNVLMPMDSSNRVELRFPLKVAVLSFTVCARQTNRSHIAPINTIRRFSLNNPVDEVSAARASWLGQE